MARGVKRNFPSGDVPDGEEQVRDDRKAYVDENKRGNETDDGRMLQVPLAKHAPCERKKIPRCAGI